MAIHSKLNNTLLTSMASLMAITVSCGKDMTVIRREYDDSSDPSGEPEAITVKRISLSRKMAVLRVGVSKTLEAEVAPENITDVTIVWSSGNEDVATVEDGVVTAKGSGEATVTATAGGASASCLVRVVEDPGAAGQCVDLGLHVDWCVMDLGAGDRYAWGETSPKSYYDWSTYTHCTGSYDRLTKYYSDPLLGADHFPDGKEQLDIEDDPATWAMGEEYRTPTDADWVELLTACHWEEMESDGIKGYMVSSIAYPEKHILLPYGEGIKGLDSGMPGTSLGQYWSSTRVSTYTMSQFAWSLTFAPGEVQRRYYQRCYGLRIRPVKLKEI